MNLRTLTKKRDGLLQTLINLLQKQMDQALYERSLLYQCKQALGTDATPDDEVDDAVACAATVTTLLHRIDVTIPIVASTATLYDILRHRKDYQLVDKPSPETIVLSPTGYGNGNLAHGHTGIFLDETHIASNDSATGKFMSNYTLASWRARYADKGGFPVLLFKKR